MNLDRVYEARFIARHRAKVSCVGDLFGCWLWTGATNLNGYGTIRGGAGHISETGIRYIYQAHRVALAIATCPSCLTIFQWMDEDQARLEAAHTCHVRLCSNPVHLVWKTHRENIQDVITRYGALGVPAHDHGSEVHV